jgi:23S rRNA (uracil1939-C5)-methyltransferase
MQTFLGFEVAFHPAAFVQAHIPLFERMVQAILENLQEEPSLLELYAGVGVMGIASSLKSKRVKLVENNSFSRASFSQTMKIQKKRPLNIDYFLCDVDEYVKKYSILEEVILVDPPRKGLGKEVLSCFKNLQHKKLVYVSCDQKSFLQDTSVLLEAGWNLKKCDGYLFFPSTERFEILAYFEKN